MLDRLELDCFVDCHPRSEIRAQFFWIRSIVSVKDTRVQAVCWSSTITRSEDSAEACDVCSEAWSPGELRRVAGNNPISDNL